jgi:hypothetical protein
MQGRIDLETLQRMVIDGDIETVIAVDVLGLSYAEAGEALADDDLAATGKLVLFRIPADSYEGGVLELVIHAAHDPQQRADLVV